MIKKQHGWMNWIYVKNQIEPVDHEFFKKKEQAEYARIKAYEEIDGVDNVTLVEGIYNFFSGEFVEISN